MGNSIKIVNNYKLPSGNIYTGELFKKKPHGYGTELRKVIDGYIRYCGEWNLGLRVGEGISELRTRSGNHISKMVGTWEDGYFVNGIYYLPGGNKIEGDFNRDGTKCNGSFTSENGTVYIGEFEKFFMYGEMSYYLNGPGTIVRDQTTTFGTFKESKLIGKTTVVYKNGSQVVFYCAENGLVDPDKIIIHTSVDGTQTRGYKLDITEDGLLRMGDGEYTSIRSNGIFMKGYFSDRMLNGEGRVVSEIGNVYSGNFVDGKLYGDGFLNLVNGESYHGNWVDGKRDGYGRSIFSDKSIYVGEWRGDKQHGYGKMIYKDGSFYDGEWSMGTRHGEGSFTDSNGRVQKGIWVYDMIVSAPPM